MVELVARTVPPNVERTPRFVLAASAALNVEFDAIRSPPKFETPVRPATAQGGRRDVAQDGCPVRDVNRVVVVPARSHCSHVCVARRRALREEGGVLLSRFSRVPDRHEPQLRVVGADDRARAGADRRGDCRDSLARALDVHVRAHEERVPLEVVDPRLDLDEVRVRGGGVGDSGHDFSEHATCLNRVRLRAHDQRVRETVRSTAVRKHRRGELASGVQRHQPARHGLAGRLDVVHPAGVLCEDRNADRADRGVSDWGLTENCDGQGRHRQCDRRAVLAHLMLSP